MLRARPMLAATLGLLVASTAAQAQELDFFKLIAKGDYKSLEKKVKDNLDLTKCDPALKFYMEQNLAYLKSGAKKGKTGNKIILFRGVKNDKPYKAQPTSGGTEFLLPNTIRYQRTSWDTRLKRIPGYFTEATTQMGGDGKKLWELNKIIEHHKGGGLGTASWSVKSVLISAATRPISTFGPPFYIIEVPAERCIFNVKGLSSEYEVLLPFWVLPNEIVAKCNSMEEVLAHPKYKESKLTGLDMKNWSSTNPIDNWSVIEANIRNLRNPLEGINGVNCYVKDEADPTGPDADAEYVDRFIEKAKRHGAEVERVSLDDPRMPDGVLARTYMHDGKPKVILPPEGTPVKKIALLEELIHVMQIDRALKSDGREATEDLLRRADAGDTEARKKIAEWEIRAKKLILAVMDKDDPTRATIEKSIASYEADAAANDNKGMIDAVNKGQKGIK